MAENLSIAQEHFKNNFIDISIREFQEIIKKEPANFLAHLYLSRALEKKGNQEQSKGFFVLALEEAKLALKTSTGVNKEIHQHLINMFHKCDQLDIAIVQYKKLAAANPGNEYFAECVKQISALSTFSVNAVAHMDEKNGNTSKTWFFMILIIGAIVLIVIFITLQYFKMNPALK